MVTLTGLPNELLAAIFTQLCNDRFALATVARCCHRLYGNVVCQLYANVVFQPRDVNYLLHFTSTVLDKAELASHVRRLTFRYDSAEDKGKELVKDGIPRPLLQAVERAAQFPDNRNTWLEHLMSTNNEEALFALLLPALPKVASLDLDWDAERMKAGYCTRLFHRCASQSAPIKLEHLTHFRSTFDARIRGEWTPGISSMDAALILQIPSLRSFATRIQPSSRSQARAQAITETLLESDQHRRPTLSLQSLPLGSCGLTYLELRATETNLEELAGVIGACTSLSTLIFEWVAPDIDSQFDTSRLHDCISPAAPSLKKLSLEYYMDADWDDRELSNATAIPPLSDFLLIEHLKLGMIYAFGWETPPPTQPAEVERFGKDCIENLQSIVPPSTSTLELTCCDTEQDLYPLMQIVKGFVSVMEDSFPRLQTIIVEVCTYGWDDAKRADPSSLPVLDGFEEIKEYCGQLGILLEKRVVHFEDEFSVLWGFERVARSDLHDGMLC